MILIFLVSLAVVSTDHLSWDGFSVLCYLLSEDFTDRQATGIGWVVSMSVESFIGAGSLWSAATFCTAFLPVTLGPDSMCASHLGPLVCRVGIVLRPFTAVTSTEATSCWDCTRLLCLSFSLPMPSVLFAQIHPPSDVSECGALRRVCVLCWKAVLNDSCLRETWTSSHSAMLLMSPIYFFLVITFKIYSH